MNKTIPLLLLLAGCAAGSTAARDGSRTAEVGPLALEACRDVICPPRVEVTLQERCVADWAERFAKLPDARARRAFLVEAGCPAATVDGRTSEPRPGP
jgi:hypothetical protein